jgi:phosphoglycolate phosphatase
MTAVRALLFDLDGTLTDNYVGISASIRHAFACLDLAAPDDATLRRCVGPPLRESFAHLLGSRDRTLIERALTLYRERYTEIGWRENAVYDGIVEALAALAARDARLFLCTAKPEPFARRIVAHFGFDAHFAGIYAADLQGAFDDKARLLEHLLEAEHVDPRVALMIGDRDGDVRAAHANAVRAIGVLWGYGTREELADADALVATPDQLVSLVASAQSSA